MAEEWTTRAKRIQENILTHSVNLEFPISAENNGKQLLPEHLQFILFPLNKRSFTELEMNSLKKMTKQCIQVKENNKAFVSVIYVSVEIPHKLNEDFQVPIIRLRCVNNGNETITFIDHTGKVYDTWDNFKQNNQLRGYRLCVTSDGTYSRPNSSITVWDKESQTTHLLSNELVCVNYCFTDQYQKVPCDDIKHAFNDINRNIETLASLLYIQNIIYLIYKSDSTFVNDITDSLKIQLRGKENILDALLNGFRDVTGKSREHLGKSYFITNIGLILKYSNSLQKFELVNGQLQIKCNYALLTAGIEVKIKQHMKTIKGKYKELQEEECHNLEEEIKNNLSDVIENIYTISSTEFENKLYIYISSKTHKKDYKFIKSIIESIKSQFKNNKDPNIIDKLLKTMKQPIVCEKEHADVYFITHLADILKRTDFFTKCEDIDGVIHIPCTLLLHPKTFVQLKEKDWEFLLTRSKGQGNKLKIKYGWFTEEKVCKISKKVCSLLKVESLDQFSVNGKRILKGNKPFELNNLKTMLKQTTRSVGDFISLAVDLANLMECKNADEFRDIYEYGKLVVTGRLASQKNVKNDGLNNEIKQFNDDQYKKTLILELKNLMVNCAASMTEKNKFNDLSAAKHFKKHCINESTFLKSEKEYFKIASEMTSRETIPFVWTQDGLAKGYKTIDKGVRYRLHPVLSDNPIGSDKCYVRERGCKTYHPFVAHEGYRIKDGNKDYILFSVMKSDDNMDVNFYEMVENNNKHKLFVNQCNDGNGTVKCYTMSEEDQNHSVLCNNVEEMDRLYTIEVKDEKQINLIAVLWSHEIGTLQTSKTENYSPFCIHQNSQTGAATRNTVGDTGNVRDPPCVVLCNNENKSAKCYIIKDNGIKCNPIAVRYEDENGKSLVATMFVTK